VTDHPPLRNHETAPVAQKETPIINLVLFLASSLSALLFMEIGYRVVTGLHVFKWVDWRVEQVTRDRFANNIRAIDPVLGWTTLPWTRSDNFESIDHGIRRNFEETTVRTGAVLAVGDSFTEGWEVGNNESWPAALEHMTGVPVVNAGVSGYGTDQIILRAELLLPIVKPKILIIGFLEHDIFRTAYSTYGAPKPYFTIESGELRYHPPGPLEPRVQGGLMLWISHTLRDGLGYSAAADYVLGRLNPDYWYGTAPETLERRGDADEVAETCALLKRLKMRTDAQSIHAILFMQYSAQSILASRTPTREALDVERCAREIGMSVADQFASLRSIADRNRIAMKQYYLYYNRTYEHMSAKGNRHAAELLAAVLQDSLKVLSRAQ
jgi:hypothetical protein